MGADVIQTTNIKLKLSKAGGMDDILQQVPVTTWVGAKDHTADDRNIATYHNRIRIRDTDGSCGCRVDMDHGP